MWVIADSIRLKPLRLALRRISSDRIGIRSDCEVDDVSDVVCVCVTVCVCVCRRVERAYRIRINFLFGTRSARVARTRAEREVVRAGPDRRGRRRRTHVGAPATARGVATVGGGACAPCTGRDRPLKSSKKRPEKDTTGHVDA